MHLVSDKSPPAVVTLTTDEAKTITDVAVHDTASARHKLRERSPQVGHIGREPRHLEGEALTDDAELLLQIIAATAGVSVSHYANYELVDIPLTDGRIVRFYKGAGQRGYGLHFAEISPGTPKVIRER